MTSARQPFFSRFWAASLVNLLLAAGLTALSFLDVLIAPFGSWTVGQPAAASYRAPTTHSSYSEDLVSVLGIQSQRPERFIVRYGETVSESQLAELQRLVPERMGLDNRRTGGVLIFYFLSLTFFNLALRRSRKKMMLRLRAVFSVYLFLTLTVLASRLALSYTTLSHYALPVALTGLLIAPLMRQNLAFVVHLLALALVAPMIGLSRGTVLIPLVSGWTAILLLDRDSGPGQTLLASAVGAVTGGLFLIGLSLFTPQTIDFGLRLEGDLAGLIGGTLLAGLAAGLFLHANTRLFGSVTGGTVRKLLELDHPLLVDLAEKAPGTFQHCLSVANMAEKVADDIGADADLVRAGAYYHDIGKMQLPEYFIENQQGENPHDQLTPVKSAEKLRSHIEAGVTIARGANLPERIIDFIIEHHGNSTMEFFKDKAQRAKEASQPGDFRYGGRNPSSRETALLMIVDSVEAASRTLSEPKQKDLENLVRRILFGKLLQGYLDDSGLTAGDLKRIGISLIKFLQAQFHGRVAYPWQKEEKPPTEAPPAIIAPPNGGEEDAGPS